MPPRKRRRKSSRGKHSENVPPTKPCGETTTMDHCRDGVKQQKSRMGSLNSTIITTKRLSVGCKGIFGNMKNSNSVYRDLVERIEKKKLSKAVSSEIKMSLSRIVPHRKSLLSSASLLMSSRSEGYKTPGCQSNANETSLCRSEGSNTAEKCKTPIESTYSKISKSILSNLPKLNFAEDDAYLRDVKSELKKIYAEKFPMDLKPKFRKEDFLKESQPDEVSKKSSPAQDFGRGLTDVTNVRNGEGEMNANLEKTVANLSHVTKVRDLGTHSTSSIFQTNKIFEQANFNQPITNLYDQLTNEHGAVLRPMTGVDHFLNQPIKESRFVSDQPIIASDFQPLFSSDQPISAAQILNQPISSLRKNRRQYQNNSASTNSQATKESQQPGENFSDFLDFIDNIPLQTLEQGLFGSAPHPRGLEAELVKPTFESPSPPKYYRMSMF